MKLSPNLDEYLQLAQAGSPVLVTLDLLADVETPLSVYWKLAHDELYSFLLESVTGGEQVARYSFMGVQPSQVIRSKSKHVRIVSPGHEESRSLEPGQDPLSVIEEELPRPPINSQGLPKFVGGAVGMIGYDYVRFIEKLPEHSSDDLNLDEVAMMICRSVLAFDHAKNIIKIMVLADGSQPAYDSAKEEIQRIVARIKGPLPSLPAGQYPDHPVTSNVTQEQFETTVSKMKQYITAGDAFQLVPSQRFQTEVDAHAITIYRCLRSLNPSPYMFLFRFGDFDIVGASPELLVGLQAGTARLRPIAGTRWRSSDPLEDRRLSEELLADEKERAEHIMLVDLGRNDLGRVCESGTVQLGEFMVVERYSHVMHIVSDLTGKLKADQSGFDLFRACFPAGTVSGAPKVRAMQIIDELETTRRGLYAGCVGYFSANGDIDTAIALRTILIKDSRAYVQAGAGIVFDSDPTAEYVETKNKAAAALQAIAMAQASNL